MTYPTALLTAVPEQRAQPVALSICKVKPVALSGQGVSGAILPVLAPQPTNLISHGSYYEALLWQVSECEGLPTAEYSP